MSVLSGRPLAQTFLHVTVISITQTECDVTTNKMGVGKLRVSVRQLQSGIWEANNPVSYLECIFSVC